MIVFVTGDLLAAKESYIAQGVAEGNQEGLGTGLALKISKKWPNVQAAFKKYARTGRFIGGHIWTLEPDGNRPGFIYLATQPDMYHATLPYLRKAVRGLVKRADKNRVESIALPKIGSGLGKLSWLDEVKPLLMEQLTPGPTRYVVYETFLNEFENSAPPRLK
ncbi:MULTISPECIES: macro domain-containing protein [unclassified Mesorhizobium]|uniref:macro domain-containing protein n=1 Tax=unclassified Mesorhizobium TaxID=325217 RepID=UPI0003CEE918|nr:MULTISPECIES: macro domain-containing protein [unclassified Mesorhizobium]ESY55253.1 Appr-1-p processing protein [Mesorhizobium sp. LNJC374B00]ESY57126.1 Appr-1-p processing protein [Mesorhizobium sp. LNJC372A00]WJI83000.1 macro domain-containing protein [Mesorhizobium sp. C374B]WJI89521.1 macro domain-containing protein [Mesorhizobium sp. C372A]